MSLETIHILLNIIMIFAALYLICIGAFTYGLMLYRHHMVETHGRASQQNVSVLIAARNEGPNIERLLQSLYNQSFDKEKFEVIIVDDHSDDNTFEIAHLRSPKNSEFSTLKCI